MKRNVILATTILTIAAMQLAGCRPNWQEYTFEEANFIVEFPYEADYYGGAEFQVNYKNSVSTIRVTKNGLKIYGLEVAVPDGEDVYEGIDRFFASFRFIESMD